jgi:uncharacterized membrane protein
LVGFAEQERSFQITDYQAQARILENGDIQVSEIFIYDFDGNFNGIIRSIGTGGSDGLAYFRASEYSSPKKNLETSQSIEGEMVTFRIYDQSSNERKSFLLEYQLKNVITSYNDIAEFYWKFFDQTNTSPIDRISIEVIFPNQIVAAEDLRVFGHGPSNGQVSIKDQGVVLYEVEGLPAGEMVEARILFPNSLVPSAGRVINKDQFDLIMQEELDWAKKSDRESIFIIFGLLLIPVIVVFNIIMAIRLYFKYDRELKPELKLDYYRELPQDITPAVLSQLMSIQGAGTKDIMATLMDLARKEYLKLEEVSIGRQKDYQFSILNKDTGSLKEHETDLIEWLIYVIGNGESVTLKGIEKYAKASFTQSSFFNHYKHWLNTVKKEFKKYNYLGESKPGLMAALRTVLLELVGVLVLIVMAFLFRVQWFIIIPLLFVVGITGLGLIIYGALIRKKTQVGVNEYHKWSAFKRFLLHFSNMKDYEIPSIVVWEHYLVYAISLGIAEKVISKLRPILADQNINMGNSAFLYHMTSRNGQLNASVFRSFDKSFSNSFVRVSPSTGSGGGFSSGGGRGGGGGGGGGAGAF